MQTRNYCAYNQTRECFLGLEVVERDLRHAQLRDLATVLTLKSGEGLWVVPFAPIPTLHAGSAIDLLFLDSSCRVIDMLESFLPSREIPAQNRADSLLILPPHTIFSSQTKRGDQLVICMAEEMQSRLEQLVQEAANPVIQEAALLRETPLWSGGPGVVESALHGESFSVPPVSGSTHEMKIANPGKRSFRTPRNWLERWWSPDPRRAPREPAHGLAAYYWNGSAPVPHEIRDISTTGMYLLTEERWYPGTLVLMTLQRTDSGEEAAERSIYVHSRAVRWGADGVGLQFVVPEQRDPLRGREFMMNSVDRKQLDRFLQKLLRKK